MNHLLVLVPLAGLVAFPAAAQNRFLYETGPSGTPPGMYSTPYDPYNNMQNMQRPIAPRPTPPGLYDLPTRNPRGPYSTGDTLPPIRNVPTIYGPGPNSCCGDDN
jgi:hypothetical protein